MNGLTIKEMDKMKNLLKNILNIFGMMTLNKLLNEKFNKHKNNKNNLLKEFKKIKNEIYDDLYYENIEDDFNFWASNVKWYVKGDKKDFLKKKLIIKKEHTYFWENDILIFNENFNIYNENVLLDYSKIRNLECFNERYEKINNKFKKEMIREKYKEIYLNKFHNKLPVELDKYIMDFF